MADPDQHRLSSLLLKGRESEVLAYLSSKFAFTTANWRYQNRDTLLHIAVSVGASEAVVRALLNATEKEEYIKLESSAAKKNNNGDMPLHVAVRSNAAEVVVVKALLAAHGDAAREKNYNGDMPLHIAASAGASEAVLRALLDAHRDAAKDKNNNGDTPLHTAASVGASVAVVCALRNAHTDAAKEKNNNGDTPLHVAASVSTSREVVWALLAVHRDAAKEKNNNGDIPLDLVVRSNTSDEAVVSALLAVHGDAAKEKNTTGDTPLHVAASVGASEAVVRVLLNAHGGAAKEKNNKGDMPLHVAASVGTSKEVVWALLAAHGGAANEKNNNREMPLYLAMRSNASEVVVKGLLNALLDKDPSAITDVPEPLLASLSGTDLHALHGKYKDNELQERLKGMSDTALLTSEGVAEWLSLEASKRWNVFLLVLKFYLHVGWISVFVYGTLNLIEFGNSNAVWPPISMIVGAICFFVIEFLQFRSMKNAYWEDSWNWFDIFAILLVLASAICLWRDLDTNAACRLYMTTGFFQLVTLLSFLKNTFLPFSTFIVGLVKIFRVIVPFLVVSACTLFAFAFMYFVGDKIEPRPFEDPGAIKHTEDDELYPFSTLHGSFTQVLTTFSSGPQEDTSVLDIFFGITVTIILLNVVIAIVSNAWDEATSEAEVSFLKHRLSLGFRAKENSLIKYLNGLDCWDPLKEFEYKTPLAFFGMCLLAIPGVVSAGLLWPKSIREYLFTFKPKKTENTLSKKTINDINSKLEKQSAQIRELVLLLNQRAVQGG